MGQYLVKYEQKFGGMFFTDSRCSVVI